MELLIVAVMLSMVVVLVAIPAAYVYRVRKFGPEREWAFLLLLIGSIGAGIGGGIGGLVLGISLACANATSSTFQGCGIVGILTAPLGFDIGVATVLIWWARREYIG